MDKLTEQLAEALPAWMRDKIEISKLRAYLQEIAYAPSPDGDVICIDQAAAMSLDLIEKLLIPFLLAYDAAKANGGWLPIESAPKDGELIIAGWHNFRGQWIAEVLAPAYLYSPQRIADPTHWRSLPPPPEQPK